MRRLDRSVFGVMQKVEKVLIRLVVLGVVALVLVQLATVRAKDPLDFYLTFAREIESVPAEQVDVTWSPNLVLALEGGTSSPLKIFVNDEVAGDLKEGKLALKVKKGDKLAADARNISGSIRLKVAGLGQELSFPALNQVWLVRGSVLDLGVVNTR